MSSVVVGCCEADISIDVLQDSVAAHKVGKDGIVHVYVELVAEAARATPSSGANDAGIVLRRRIQSTQYPQASSLRCNVLSASRKRHMLRR